jgi:hypothetical protein
MEITLISPDDPARYCAWDYGAYHTIGIGNRTICNLVIPARAIRIPWSTPEGRCQACERYLVAAPAPFSRQHRPAP